MEAHRKPLTCRAALATAMSFSIAPAWALQAAAQSKPLFFSIPLPLTGPVAYTGALMLHAWHDALDWINKDGGIRGRKVEAQIYDDQYNVDMAVAGFKQAASNHDLVFAGIDGTNAIRAIAPMDYQQYKLLTANPGNTSDQIDVTKYPYNLLMMPTYSDMFNIWLPSSKASCQVRRSH
jgi:branched-chain amino acid transport system substrate-binding protein